MNEKSAGILPEGSGRPDLASASNPPLHPPNPIGTPGKRLALSAVLNAAGPFFGLLLVLGLFCLSSEVRPYLFTGANFKIILVQTVIVAIGALGMTLIIVSGGIDLSVGSVVALTSVFGATLLIKGFSPVWT